MTLSKFLTVWWWSIDDSAEYNFEYFWQCRVCFWQCRVYFFHL